MTDSIYKSFDSSQSLFENIWKHFPNITTEVKNDVVKNKLLNSSREFCDLIKKKFFSIKYFSEGSFGAVGKISIGSKPIKAAILSIERTGKNNLFYVDTIVKIGKQIVPIKIYRIDMNTVAVTDPMSDMVFGSLLGHLYDIGVNPFVTKYFGTYACDNNETGMIIEASSYELRQILNHQSKNRITPSQLANIIAQYVFSLYILKIYFGFVHFDTHLRNIMVTDIDTTEYMYHGKSMKNIEYILLETNRKDNSNHKLIVCIKKNKYLLKIIDYGSLYVSLQRSEIKRFRKDLNIQTDMKDIINIGAGDALSASKKSKSYANTVDLMFTLINMYEYMYVGLYNTEISKIDPAVAEENKDYINVINNFTLNLIGMTMESFLEQNPQLRVRKNRHGVFHWFMNNHNSGIENGFENPDYLILGLLKSCTQFSTMHYFPIEGTKYTNKTVSIGYWEDEININNISNDNSLFLTFNTSDYNMMFNRIEKIIDYNDSCDVFDSLYCDVVKLYDQVPFESFQDDKIFEKNDNFRIIFRNSHIESNPLYKDYNSWLNGMPIPKEKVGKPLENVRIFLVEFLKFNTASLSINDPMTTAHGMSVPLGHSVIFNNRVLPLGFCATKTPYHVSDVNQYYPNDYNHFLAVLSFDGSSINLEPFDIFVSKHVTEQKSHYINKNVLEKIIFIKHPPELKEGLPYQWAVTVGPILVWDSNIVFDSELIKNAVSSKTLYQNESNNLFCCNTSSYYGMTDSTEIQSHIIYCVRKTRKGFLFVEGGGFMSQGIDRINAAILCKNLGMEFAVCVYTGYSSNILLKKNSKSKYLSKSPIRLTHGAVMNLHW